MMVATYHVLPCLARDKLSLAGCTTALWGRGSPPRERPAQAPTGPSGGGARAQQAHPGPGLGEPVPSPRETCSLSTGLVGGGRT